MKRKEVLIAVIGGCFGALVTMLVGLFAPMGVVAQNQDAVFGKITCTEIAVVDSSGERRCFIFSDEDGEIVLVFGKEGRAGLITDEHGGGVAVSGKGKGKAGMTINAYRNGTISTLDKNAYRQ